MQGGRTIREISSIGQKEEAQSNEERISPYSEVGSQLSAASTWRQLGRWRRARQLGGSLGGGLSPLRPTASSVSKNNYWLQRQNQQQ